ncbi:MAG: glycerol-3-phosphate dehydrogenase/oxidase [Actinomycetaceae bacterium]|nr:glycerol-3-phosphate dehydrogenase/oxidase [Actinomycetaceae bacterium]
MTETALTLKSSSLNAPQRSRHLAQASDTLFDLIVVGGGITGTGVALDAAMRGLKVILVEANDLANGTSRWSSKLAHGGLRYLATGQVDIAYESAVERRYLLTKIAPHLTCSTPFLLPLDSTTSPLAGLLGWAGAQAGNALRVASHTSRHILPSPSRISAKTALALAPCLDADNLRGADMYWDGQLVDDARLVLAVARTAAAFGARIVTRARVLSMTENRVQLHDELGGHNLELRGRTVINATGVWAAHYDPRIIMAPSRGSHVLVKAEALGYPRAVVTSPVPEHFGRYIFAVPQADGLVMIGLTDVEVKEVDASNPPVPLEDEQFILSVINGSLGVELGDEDIVGRFAGIRPLIRSKDADTCDISRNHVLLDDPGLPLTITGGKLTTYRQMAQDAVDGACRRLGIQRRCHTKDLGLIGAGAKEIINASSPNPWFQRNYGKEAARIEELGRIFPHLAERLVEDLPATGTQMLFGVLHEGALETEDLLARRTRLAVTPEYASQAQELAQEVMDLGRTLLDSA